MATLTMSALLASSSLASNWGVTDFTNECDTTVKSQCGSNQGFQIFDVSNVQDPDGFIKPAIRWEAIYEFQPIADVSFVEGTYSNADQRIWSVDINNGWWAWTICPVYATKGKLGTRRAWCNPQVVYLNNGPVYGFPENYNSATEAKSITCHEMGHGFGLRHATSTNGGANWNLSCMVPNQRTRIHLTDDHDAPALTAYYPNS